jgi:hypothetical protein
MALVLLHGCIFYCKGDNWILEDEQDGVLVLEVAADEALVAQAQAITVEEGRYTLSLSVGVELRPWGDDGSDTAGYDSGASERTVRITVEKQGELLYDEELSCDADIDLGQVAMARWVGFQPEVSSVELRLGGTHRSGAACAASWRAWATLHGPTCCDDDCYYPPAGTELELDTTISFTKTSPAPG